MANRRVIVKRRKSVRNIRKITRTMQLIATARFQAAFNRATASKPYTQKLAELVGEISRAAEGASHPLLQTNESSKTGAVVAITTARGLCGGYNAHVLRSTIAHLDAQTEHGIANDVYMVGKKGINFFRFLDRPTRQRITDISDAPRFEQVERLANHLMDRFQRGEVKSVHVAYMRFHSMARQRPEVMQLLPMTTASGDSEGHHAGAAARKSSSVQFDFSPAPAELLNELLPATVRIRLFQCFLEAAVGEQIARMVAMKAATDAAGDMITLLTRQYNRARQTHITMELLDIIGGVNALA